MAETATDTTNSFLRPELLETNVPVVPKISSTGQLTSAGILDKLDTGAPIYEGERLPDVPKGMSARQFYSQFPSGAAVYSGFASSPTAKTPKYTGGIDFFDPTTPTDTSTPSDTVQGDVDSQMDEVLDLSGDNDIIDYSVTDDSEDSVDVLSLDTPETREDYTPVTKAPEEFTIDVSLKNIDIPELQQFLKGVEDEGLVKELGKTLETGFNNISKGIDKGVDDFVKEVEEFGKELGKFADGPVSYVSNAISKEVTNLLDLLSTPELAFEKAVHGINSAAIQGVFSNVVSGLFSMMGLGVAAGPLGTIATTIIFNSDTLSNMQIGQPGQYETLTKNKDGTLSATYTPTQVAYFDLHGVARDKNGKQVLTPGPLWGGGGSGMFGKPTKFDSIPLAIHDIEGGAKTDPYNQSDLFKDMSINEDPTIDTPPDDPEGPDTPDTPDTSVTPISSVEDDKPSDPLTTPDTLDRPDDGTVVDSGVTPSGIDMGGSVTSVQVQDNLENKTIDVGITDLQGKVDNFSVEDIANGNQGTVTLDTLYSMLASLYDPSMMPDPSKGIGRDPEVVNKRGIDAVTKAIAEKERDKELKGSEGDDDLSFDPFADMPLDEDPTIDSPPDDTGFDNTMDDTAGYDSGYDDTMDDSAEGDDSGSDGSGNGGEDEAGAEAGDI